MTEEIEELATAPTVKALVHADHRVADVLLKYGINYCCSGNMTLEQACTLKGADFLQVQTSITAAQQKNSLLAITDAEDWPLKFLTDYIIHVQHRHFKQTMPLLQQQLQKFVVSHQKKKPELNAIKEAFEQIHSTLSQQMRKEEENIFPYIKHVEAAHCRHESYAPLFVRTLRRPIDALQKETQRLQALLQQLNEITNGYEHGPGACINQIIIFEKLKLLDQNLQRHTSLENEIMYPRLAQIEAAVLR